MTQTIRGGISPTVQNLVRSFADSIMALRSPNQVIGRNNEPYIERWMLARKAFVPVYDDHLKSLYDSGPMLSELENIYIHRYVKSDTEAPHDHPWANATLVLHGWYDELVIVDGEEHIYTRFPGDIVLRPANAVHSIIGVSTGTPEGIPCVTLFATLQKERDWGFWDGDKFTPWQQFDGNTVLEKP
jgi:hypothetical protein